MKPPTPEVRVKEILGFTLNEITVFVCIDYETRQVSLVNKDGNPKQWLFAKRGQEYFEGWRNILDAMQYAINRAQTRLEDYPSILEKVLIAEAERGNK